jgi:hypothetical protein
MSKQPPSNYFLGWLGRQIGHVTKAVKTDVKPEPKVIYRDDKVEEAKHPTEPNMKLRRTVIDEVIVDPKTIPAQKPSRK